MHHLPPAHMLSSSGSAHDGGANHYGSLPFAASLKSPSPIISGGSSLPPESCYGIPFNLPPPPSSYLLSSSSLSSSPSNKMSGYPPPPPPVVHHAHQHQHQLPLPPPSTALLHKSSSSSQPPPESCYGLTSYDPKPHQHQLHHSPATAAPLSPLLLPPKTELPAGISNLDATSAFHVFPPQQQQQQPGHQYHQQQQQQQSSLFKTSSSSVTTDASKGKTIRLNQSPSVSSS